MNAVSRPAGSLTILGLGPGAVAWLTPAAQAAIAEASDLVGYAPYLAQIQDHLPGQRRHASDNRVELDRARHALDMAAEGRSVALISGGDPGIFAMAAAAFEALEAAQASGSTVWDAVEIRVEPGISAMQAAAARVGAPLGHDFCVISLSDNLKPWAIVARRLEAVAAADLVLALYNPISRQRPWQLAEAFQIMLGHRAPSTPVVLGRDIGRPGETVRLTDLARADPAEIDMRTVVLIGSSTTRRWVRADGSEWVYTPRSYPGEPA
ncbi:MAG TPA: precorrin-3B C(17)-methyltransferase [Stellaceae bacterium]|nr:precorrin-3B C(17)-methyltransferase [Stellaceae bacterium]